MTPDRVTVTLNGKKIQVPAGLLSFRELVQAGTLPSTTKSFAVTPVTLSSTINGNGSYNFVGGEVLTSS